ncbi:sensor histidine kinase [Amycolatopsis pigmentata]|uniref:histidine kinase n=1 Tax=Amycolatopsis pigmentata TaxID=450801 RepID=A0ABW5FIH8_9PSEU
MGRSAPDGQRAAHWRDIAARAHLTLDSLDRVVGGVGTAVLAASVVLYLLVVVALCVVGVGVLLAPGALRIVRTLADRERARLSRWKPEILTPEPVPAHIGAALRDSPVRRELSWVVWHGTGGLLIGLIALTLPLDVVHDVSLPLWWKVVPANLAGPSLGFWMVHDWAGALTVCLSGLAAAVVAVLILPGMAWLQAWPGTALLPPARGTDLALRVAELTATRAAALDAHATELRRIERSLHDGTQNRLVAVTILLGAAQRALERNPVGVGEFLGHAQEAAEEALIELRRVVRSILPPVLTERSLPDALAALAVSCPVSCRIDANLSDRYAASLEAVAYFVVAEALTNVAKHSNADEVTVRLRNRGDRLFVDITDNGDGGANEHGGSGITGIRQRIEAHDGTFTMSSPVGGPTVLSVSLPCGL